MSKRLKIYLNVYAGMSLIGTAIYLFIAIVEGNKEEATISTWMFVINKLDILFLTLVLILMALIGIYSINTAHKLHNGG